jgi:uncharacterized membrane protein
LRRDWLRLTVAGVALGAVIASNTWEVPVLWGVFSLALVAWALRPGASITGQLRARLGDLVVTLVLAVLLFSPYFVGYVSQPLSVATVAERTPFGSLLVLFGPLVLVALAGGAVGIVRLALGPAELPEHRILVGVGLAGVGAGLLFWALREPTLGFLVATLAMWAALAWQRARAGASAGEIATAILVIIGTGSILAPELVYLHDLFGSRMNTVFKFYYDAWIVLAVAAPLVGLELVRELFAGVALEPDRGAPTLVARAVASLSLGAAALLTLGGLIYPLTATATKSAGFAGHPTLDGMVHLRNGRADDAAAIDWLRAHHPGAPVVEAVGDDYTDAGRFSTFAGVATLVGWGGHEVQWRGSNPAIEQRKRLAQRVYTDPDDRNWRGELEALGVRYIVVGSLERELYGPEVGATLAQRLPVAHRTGNTRIYALAAPLLAGRDAR